MRTVTAGIVIVLALVLAWGSGDRKTAPDSSRGRKLAVGSAAPPLKLEKLLQAPKNARADWESLRGNAVVLEFWATWCGPCVAAIPHMNKLADEFKDKPIRFLSITDEAESKIAGFLKKKEMKSWVGLDTDRSVFDAYGVTGVPTTVLVDKQGRIALVTYPTYVTESLLDKLIEGDDLGPVQESVKTVAPQPEHVIQVAPLVEVSIRPASGTLNSMSGGVNYYEFSAWRASRLVSFAYDFPANRIDDQVGLGDTLYDATVIVPLSQWDQRNRLLRHALRVGLGFRTRHEQRENDVYLLEVGPDGLGKNMMPTATPETGAFNSSDTGMVAVNQTVGGLCRSLESLLDKPVLDRTGLKDGFDWTVEFAGRDAEDIIKAVRQQLGFNLRESRASVEFLVIRPAKRKAIKTAQTE